MRKRSRRSLLMADRAGAPDTPGDILTKIDHIRAENPVAVALWARFSDGTVETIALPGPHWRTTLRTYREAIVQGIRERREPHG